MLQTKQNKTQRERQTETETQTQRDRETETKGDLKTNQAKLMHHFLLLFVSLKLSDTKFRLKATRGCQL